MKSFFFGIFLFTALFHFSSGQAQQGYDLKFKINGLRDTTIFLGYYYGESTFVKDTAAINSNGEFRFAKDEPLEHGVYFLVLGRSKLFDIAAGKDQAFSILTNTTDYIMNMTVEGDLENQLFLENARFNFERNQEAGPWIAQVKDSTLSEEKRQQAREKLQEVDKQVRTYQDKIIEQYPETIITRIFKANKRIDVPDPPVLENGKPDSSFSYRYYRTHYWDYFDLADEAMIRMPSPFYQQKVNDYLDKLLLQQTDTIMSAIKTLAQVAKKNQETYKYFIWTVTTKYQNPEIMGLDEVFVKLYDQYFATGEMDYWANASLKKNLKERADQLRRSLIGSKAPNLIMQDRALNPRALHDISKKYTVIYFFDPDCGFCKKETPRLKEFYENTQHDVEVYAVSADTSMTKMAQYIDDNQLKWVSVNGPRSYVGSYQKLYDAATTPTIYILDEKKKIIAKKLRAEQLQGFLDNHAALEKTTDGD